MAKLYLDQCNRKTNSAARTVIADGEWKTGTPSIALAAGRILGSRETFAHATVSQLYRMDAVQLREMAAAFLLAADWLDGKAEATDVIVAE